MITSELPVATTVQPARYDPTVAAGRPFISTDVDPITMGAKCVKHILAGTLCGVDTSPTLAAPRPLINTSDEAVAIT